MRDLVRWDLPKNERDLSELRVLKAIRHLAVVGFSLSGNAGIVRRLEMECSEMALRLEEREGALQPSKGLNTARRRSPSTVRITKIHQGWREQLVVCSLLNTL